jgi:hypothetical protein
MVCALGTPKRHPESGIYLFRKRVPERLKTAVGKSEIEFLLRTRDPVVARIRNLEETARLEREWSQIHAATIDGEGRDLASVCTENPKRERSGDEVRQGRRVK